MLYQASFEFNKGCL